MLSKLIDKSRQVLSAALVDQERVWVISRMNSARDQEIYPVSEPDLAGRDWLVRGFSPEEAQRIDRMRVSAVIEFQEGRVSVMRVR